MTSKRTEEEIREQLAENVQRNDYAAHGNCYSTLIFEYDDLMRPLLDHCNEIIKNNQALGLHVMHEDHALICETLKTYNLGRIAFYASRLSFSEANSAEMLNRVVSALYNIGAGVDNL